MELEQTILDLKKKMDELKEFSNLHGIDLSAEIKKIEVKIKNYEKDMYKNLDSWNRVQLSRNQNRPTTLDYIKNIFEDFLELHGDRLFADDPAIVGGIGSFEGTPVTIIGNQKGQNTKENIYRRFGMSQPEGYRKALRLMKQADKFNRPIITFINTAGAYPGREAEERGQSEAIARNLREMAGLGVPVISIVIGEGGSGGALALGVSNKIYMLENTFYSVISPEGAAALLWKDSTRAKDAASALKVTAQNLKELGVIDEVISEPVGGAQTDAKTQAETLRIFIRKALEELGKLNREQLIEQRYNKFRIIGEFEE